MCRGVVVADSSPIPSRRQKRRFRSISVPRATFSAIIDAITSVKLFARSGLCNRSPRIRITRVSLLCLLLASGFVSSGSLSRLLTSDTSLLFRPSNYYTYTRVHSRTERLDSSASVFINANLCTVHPITITKRDEKSSMHRIQTLFQRSICNVKKFLSIFS